VLFVTHCISFRNNSSVHCANISEERTREGFNKKEKGPAGNQDLLQQAKQTTNEVVSQVQEQANSQVNRQKESAASELSTVVNAVRRFGETLNNEGQGPIARFAAQYGDKAANSLDRVAQYHREQDAKRLLDDVQNFGRRQPALLLGGAFLLGFAGARLIKSSMEAASHHQSYRPNTPGATRPPASPNAV